MGVNDLIFHLRESGFSICLNDSRLLVSPADKLTDELKQIIRQRKAEILTALQLEARGIEPIVKAADLIYTLQLGGFEFSLIDDRLSIEPYEKLTIATKELINQNDSAIIAELRRI